MWGGAARWSHRAIGPGQVPNMFWDSGFLGRPCFGLTVSSASTSWRRFVAYFPVDSTSSRLRTAPAKGVTAQKSQPGPVEANCDQRQLLSSSRAKAVPRTRPMSTISCRCWGISGDAQPIRTKFRRFRASSPNFPTISAIFGRCFCNFGRVPSEFDHFSGHPMADFERLLA